MFFFCKKKNKKKKKKHFLQVDTTCVTKDVLYLSVYYLYKNQTK